MAQQPPTAIDMTELQFPLRNKSQLFVGETSGRHSLLATASLYGILVAGSNKPELRVFQLSCVVEKTGDAIPVRTIPLNQPPQFLALSCDHSMLAVNYEQNGSSFISVYSVPSLLSNNVSLLYQNIVLSPETNVGASELLWNPVMPNTLAVTLNNGALSVINFNGQGYELHVLDKSENVRCASWSPKGKQIVVGFPGGKLAQYKPDLKLARTIPCPDNIFGAAFDVITVQWLSTYQFAAVFLKPETGECPAVFIVNAPKNVAPTYINYDDICYSQSGPRPAQVFLAHILPWNIILVASANSMEVGVLGTRETGETPTWSQYFIDGMRPEIPLTQDKQEIYPIGLAIDTGCTHRLTINEVQHEVMPMMHLLATNGLLVSFDVLNHMAGIPTLCQAPKTLTDTSGIHLFVNAAQSTEISAQNTAIAPSDVSFSVPPTAATSTPSVVQKSKQSTFSFDVKPSGTSLFGSSETKKSTFGKSSGAPFVTNPVFSMDPSPTASDQEISSKPLFGSGQSSTGGFGGAPLFGGAKSTFGTTPTSSANFGSTMSGTNATFGTMAQPTAPVNPTFAVAPVQKNATIDNKPFITVSSNYSAQSSNTNQQNTPKPTPNSFGGDENKVIRKMIAEEIKSFENEWNIVLTRSRQLNINIGTKDEMAASSKQLNELQDISGQATESTEALSLEIQSLRMLLNETFSMVAEAKAKRAMFSNVDVNTLRDTSAMSQTSRRQMEKLQRILATNETQYQIVNKQIDSFWSSHQQNVKHNQKALMHIPQLENVYMTLTKQRQILKSNAQKLSYIKSKIGYRDVGSVGANSQKHDASVNSLSDSVFSMSLCDQVKLETEKLSPGKMNALKDLLRTRQTITVITPKRPDRKGLSSEVVLERKIAQERTKVTPKPEQRQISPVTQATTDKPELQHTKPFVNKPQPIQSVAPKKLDQPIKPMLNTGSLPQIGFGSSTAGAANKIQLKPSFGPPSTSSLKQPINAGGPVSSKSPVDFTTNPISGNGFGGFKGTDKPGNSFAFGGFKAPDAFGATTPSIAFGNSNSSCAATSVPTISTPFAPTSVAFGGSSAGGPISFGSSTTPAFSGFSAPTSNPSATPAFKFSVSNSPAFGSSTSKPLTPTLNALLPKGIAAAAEVKSGVAPNTTTPSPAAKSASADKENRPIAVTAPLAQANQPFDSISLPNKPLDPLPSAPTNFGGGSNIFGSLPKTNSTSTFGSLNTAFGSTTIKPVPTGPTQASTKTTVISNSPVMFSSNMTTTAAATTPTITTEQTKPPSATTTLEFPTSSTVSSPSVQGFTFSLSGGINSVSPAPIAKPDKPDVRSEQTVPTIDGADNLFQGLSVCKPEAIISSTAQTAGSNIFSMPAFGSVKPAEITPSSVTSIFASATSVTSTSFGGTANAFGTAASAAEAKTTTSSPFAAFAAQNPGPPPIGSSIFGGAGSSLPKPEQSVFGGGSNNAFGSPAPASSNIFGGGAAAPPAFGAPAATGNSSPFGAPSATSTSSSTSIFGQSSFAQQPSNIFGQSPAAPEASGSSIFGGASVFGGGSATAPSPAPSTNSIFGGGSASALAPSSFGASPFGSPATAPSAFGQTSSIFGGGAEQTAGSGGSMFGGGFGSPSAAPAAGAGAFGGPPAFGAAPAFGGAATFGSPKGNAFGAFGQTAASPPAFATQVTQKNSLFESLGSSETGMTFGNIAQNTAANAPNAFSGGSSFSSWR